MTELHLSDGVGGDQSNFQSLDANLVDADHSKVASSVATYVLDFMSEHEKRFVKGELTSLEECRSNPMKTCVIQRIFNLLEREKPVECKCFERNNLADGNNREVTSHRKKSKFSSSDILQICFIHG